MDNEKPPLPQGTIFCGKGGFMHWADRKEDLGMVYANKDQVIMYNKTESEYVRQYEDIPER